MFRLSLGRGAAEDFLDGFKIAHAVDGVRLEVAALSPFVPGIDGDDAGVGDDVAAADANDDDGDW